MKKPPYELDALREGVIAAQKNIDTLLGIRITPENMKMVQEAIEKERDRIQLNKKLIERHLEYRRYLAAGGVAE